MSRFVRASKVRNIYPEVGKDDLCHRGYKFKQPGATDSQGIQANDKYIAVSVSNSGGSIAIADAKKPDRISGQPNCLVHKSFVQDFEFSPFHDSIMASGDDSGSAYVWGIPPEGLSGPVSEPLVDLDGICDKAINNVRFNPTSKFVVAFSSTDKTTRICDMKNEKEHIKYEAPESVLHIAWSPDGSLLSQTSKDKKVRIFDPRQKKQIHEFVAHTGSKTSKTIWLDDCTGLDFVTIGFDVQSKRQINFYDTRKTSNNTEPVAKTEVDRTNSVFMPFFDESLKCLYLQGRGETKTHIFEVVSGEPWQFHIHKNAVNKEPVRGACMVPKRYVDVMREGNSTYNKGPEVMRMYQVTSKSICPVSWIIPRKSTKFWSELFPSCTAGLPTYENADEYFASSGEIEIKKMSLDPKKNEQGGGAPKSNGLDMKTNKVGDLEKEIKRLKALLDKHKIKY